MRFHKEEIDHINRPGRRATLGLAMMVVLASLASTTSPASAVYKNGVCESNEVCQWDFSGQGGSIYDNNDGNDSNLSNNNWVGTANTVNDDYSSIYNRGANGKSMKYYENFNYNQFLLCLPDNWYASSLGSADQKISGNQKNSGSGC